MRTFSLYLQGHLEGDSVEYALCVGKFDNNGVLIIPSDINDSVVNRSNAVLLDSTNYERHFEDDTYESEWNFIRFNGNIASSVVLSCDFDTLLVAVSRTEEITDKLYPFMYDAFHEQGIFGRIDVPPVNRPPYFAFIAEHSQRELGYLLKRR